MPDIINRYCKAQTAKENISHTCYADNFPGKIKERASGIPRINIRVCLQIDQPLCL